MQELTDKVGLVLDNFYAGCYPMGVAAEDEESGGVPKEMRAGEVNGEGWVEWKILPSTVTLEEFKNLKNLDVTKSVIINGAGSFGELVNFLAEKGFLY